MHLKQHFTGDTVPDQLSMFYIAAAATITTDATAMLRKPRRQPTPAQVETQSNYATERAHVARIGS